MPDFGISALVRPNNFDTKCSKIGFHCFKAFVKTIAIFLIYSIETIIVRSIQRNWEIFFNFIITRKV